MRNRGCCSGRRDSRRLVSSPRPGFDRGDRPRRDGLVTGGFAWLAGWLGLPTWVVLAFFVVLFLTVGWPALIIYLACALLLRPELQYAGEPRTIDVTGVRLDAQAHTVRDRAQDLEARIGRLESHVTSKEFDFDRRLGETERRK